jgi:hypothetical protein
MTTPAKINKALKGAGFNVRIVRNQLGGCYYYFIDDGFDVVPSLYTYTVRDYPLERIIEHVADHMPKPVTS